MLDSRQAASLADTIIIAWAIPKAKTANLESQVSLEALAAFLLQWPNRQTAFSRMISVDIILVRLGRQTFPHLVLEQDATRSQFL